jgi:hypothetical protein
VFTAVQTFALERVTHDSKAAAFLALSEVHVENLAAH